MGLLSAGCTTTGSLWMSPILVHSIISREEQSSKQPKRKLRLLENDERTEIRGGVYREVHWVLDTTETTFLQRRKKNTIS